MRLKRTGWALFLIAFFSLAVSLGAQQLQGKELASALQRGGYVVVMRHAASPMEPPAKGEADAGNTKPERQLDAKGKSTATEMGAAIHKLHIPVDEVLSSPTFRATQTVRYAKLGNPKTYAELGDGSVGMTGGNASMMHDASAKEADWLRARVAQFRKGTNVFIVTHTPNLKAAFPNDAVDMKDGEALVFGSDGSGGAKLVARVPIEAWPELEK